MKKILLANGCSHTSGAEIEYTGQGICYEKAWPKYLSDMLEYDYINLASAGGSNQRIIRTTQDWIIKNILIDKKYQPEQICVIIMWSGYDRKELYIQKTNQLFNYTPSGIDYFDKHNILGYVLNNNEIFEELKNYYKTDVFFYDNLVKAHEFYIQLINFYSFMKFNNIETYFINGFFHNVMHFDETHILSENYKNLCNYVYLNIKKTFMGFDDEEDTYCHHMQHISSISQPAHSVNYHWGEDGHQYWAKKVYDYFFNKNLVNTKLTTINTQLRFDKNVDETKLTTINTELIFDKNVNETKLTTINKKLI